MGDPTGVDESTVYAWLRAVAAGDEEGGRAILASVNVGSLLLAVSMFTNAYQFARIGEAAWDAELLKLIAAAQTGPPPGPYDQ